MPLPIEPQALLYLMQTLVFTVLVFVFFMYLRTFSRQYTKYWLVSLLIITASYGVRIVAPNIQSFNVANTHLLILPTLLMIANYTALLYLVEEVYNTKNNVKLEKNKGVIKTVLYEVY